MPRRMLVLAGIVVAAGIATVFVTDLADAGSPPKVITVIHGVNGATGKPSLTFLGTKINKVKAVHLVGPEGGVSGDLENLVPLGKSGFTGDIPDTIVQRARTSLPETYQIEIELVALNLQSTAIIPTPTLSQGVVTRGSVLRDTIDTATVADLDDAATLGGAPRGEFVEDIDILAGGKLIPAVIPFGTGAGQVMAGDSFFDVFQMLEDTGRIGTTGIQVARGNHGHAAGDIASGTLSNARFDAYDNLSAASKVGAGATQVAAGNHGHSAADVTSGVFGIARIPVGTTSAAVALGDHTHDAAGIVSGTMDVLRLPVGTSAGTVATGDHNHDATVVLNAGNETMTGPLTFSGFTGTALTITGGGGTDSLIVQSTNASRSGIFASQNSPTTAAHGINGVTTSTLGASAGVCGQAAAGAAAGVLGQAGGVTGIGVLGQGTNATGGSTGVFGTSSSPLGVGVFAGLGTNSSQAVPLMVDRQQGGTGDSVIVRQAGTNVFRVSSAGTCFANGNFSFGGADFAERVKVDRPAAEFEAGDVIAIDPTGTRRFKLSDTADSALVVGVYSTKPGLLGGLSSPMNDEWRKDEVPLAIVGIVPMKVCDEGGEIRAGDLLVAASIPGHAKRAPENPRTGTVIGKSLGTLEKGVGSVEVFLVAR